jgi:hypothetical protein
MAIGRLAKIRECLTTGLMILSKAWVSWARATGDSMLAFSSDRIFHVRLVFVGRGYRHFGF